MAKRNFLNKMKLGLAGLVLAGSNYFNNNLYAQTTSDYKKSSGTKEISQQKEDSLKLGKYAEEYYEIEDWKKTIFQPGEDSVLENILKEFLPKSYTLTQEMRFYNLKEGGSWDEWKDSTVAFEYPINYFRYSSILDKESNQINIWENRELAKWLQSLKKSKKKSLKKSLLKEKKEISGVDLEYARQRLDSNYPPNKPVNIPGTEVYYFYSTWLLTKEESTIPGTDYGFNTQWTFTKEEIENGEFENISAKRKDNKMKIRDKKKNEKTIFLGE